NTSTGRTPGTATATGTCTRSIPKPASSRRRSNCLQAEEPNRMTLAYAGRRALVSAAAIALLSLPACSSEQDNDTATAEPGESSLAEAISDAAGMSTNSAALDDTGLAGVFDGSGSYTLFAPNDAAFEALREVGAALAQPAQHAALAAVLRHHIAPGYLTPDDIEAAIDAQRGAVTVETMGDQSLRFTRADGGIRVTGENGSSAMLAGAAVSARNGVAIPVDGVLKN